MRIRFIILSILLGALALGQCMAIDDTPDVSAQDLLASTMFPKAQYGMSIESVTDGTTAIVTTTSAVFTLRKSSSQIECRQRIGAQRVVATIQLVTGTLSTVVLTFQDTGTAIFTGGGTTVRINGDSLIMIKPKSSGTIRATLGFTPDFHSTYKGNYNFLDPSGGISFFEHGKCPTTTFQFRNDPVYVTWNWSSSNVWWACVSPPKPYDWNAPEHNKTIVLGTSEDRYMYPADYEIANWHKYNIADVIYLHYEFMWVHWNLDLTPKDPTSLRRVCNTAHENNMKVIVYASPHMFTKDSGGEIYASNDMNAWGWNTGSNAFLYMDYANHIIHDYGVDGLYWDGMYEWEGATAVNYWLTRAARQLVGDNAPLEFHATQDIFPSSHVGPICPVQHAYFSVIYKGEGEYDRGDPWYLRYIASTYNVSNSVAVACYANQMPTYAQFDRLLKNNVHFHLMYGSMYSGDDELYWQHYFHKVNAQLKDEVEGYLAQPTGTFATYRSTH